MRRMGKSKKIIGLFLTIMFLLSNILTGCSNSKTVSANVNDRLELAVKYLSDNNYDQAVLAFNEVIQIDPKEVKGYQGLARTYTLQGNYDEAKTTYDKGITAVAQDRKQTLQLGLAGMYIDQGQLENAEKAFEEIKSSSQNCPEAYWGLAMVYQKKGDNSKAEAMLRQVVEKNPNDYWGYNNLALFLKQNNQADDAFDNIIKSLTLEINQQEAYLVLSDLFQGRWTELHGKLSTISNPQLVPMLEFYSYYTCENYQKAINLYREKLSTQTGNQKARILVAISMYKAGNEAGTDTLIKQLSEDKLNVWLLGDLARYYLTAGDQVKAREYAIKALKANCTNLDAIALLQTLNADDSNGKIYAIQALLYNWKPISHVKEEMKVKTISLLLLNNFNSVKDEAAAKGPGGAQLGIKPTQEEKENININSNAENNTVKTVEKTDERLQFITGFFQGLCSAYNNGDISYLTPWVKKGSVMWNSIQQEIDSNKKDKIQSHLQIDNIEIIGERADNTDTLEVDFSLISNGTIYQNGALIDQNINKRDDGWLELEKQANGRWLVVEYQI
ncbi:MAG: tetratricopeptide repeat protein [Syntrophomonadaceae bacterium]|nr:tetratricopeptide repeat protein [Syntrophomonadaceae bacterium]